MARQNSPSPICLFLSTLLMLPCFGQVTLKPGDDIQKAVNEALAGTTFHFRPGTYRQQKIRPKSGNKFIGSSGAILNGSKVLSSFIRQRNYWVATGQIQEGQVIGVCESVYPRCNRPEELYLDSVALRHVGTLAEVGPGRWYMDYAADRLYMGDDPTGRLVEASVASFAFDGSAADVTIRGLIIEKYANPAQHGAIHAKDGTIGASGQRWVVEGNEIRLNHGAGLAIGEAMTVRRNKIMHNGQIGVVGEFQRVLHNVLLEDNEIAWNNLAGFHAGWEGGGTKFINTDGLVIRRNRVHHNTGPGLWVDSDNVRTLYEQNTVEDNAGVGIFHEVSFAAVIRNNTVRRNGKGHDPWLWGAQILIAASPNVEVNGNTVEVDSGGGDGIALIQQKRGAGRHGAYVAKNIYVHHNTVTFWGTAGNHGAGADYSHETLYGGTNRFDYNTYRVADPSAAYFMWANGPVNWKGFRSQGQEVNGTLSGTTQADSVPPAQRRKELRPPINADKHRLKQEPYLR